MEYIKCLIHGSSVDCASVEFVSIRELGLFDYSFFCEMSPYRVEINRLSQEELEYMLVIKAATTGR